MKSEFRGPAQCGPWLSVRFQISRVRGLRDDKPRAGSPLGRKTTLGRICWEPACPQPAGLRPRSAGIPLLVSHSDCLKTRLHDSFPTCGPHGTCSLQFPDTDAPAVGQLETPWGGPQLGAVFTQHSRHLCLRLLQLSEAGRPRPPATPGHPTRPSGDAMGLGRRSKDLHARDRSEPELATGGHSQGVTAAPHSSPRPAHRAQGLKAQPQGTAAAPGRLPQPPPSLPGLPHGTCGQGVPPRLSPRPLPWTPDLPRDVPQLASVA